MDAPSLLNELNRLLAEASKIAFSAREHMVKQLKPNDTVVTNADTEVETFFREALPGLVPGATIWGEEQGYDAPGPDGLWLIDPIDGTTNFSCGSPLWGISVGLYRNGEIVLGGVALPDIRETFLSAAGEGVMLNGRPLPPISPGPITGQDPVSYNETVVRTGLRIPGRMRCSGAFVVDGCFVAAQRVRGMVGLREQLYDAAPCILFCQELGGEVRYADGSRFDIESHATPGNISRPWLLFPQNSGFIAPTAP